LKILPTIAFVFTTAECLIFLLSKVFKDDLLLIETKVSAEDAAKIHEEVKNLYDLSDQWFTFTPATTSLLELEIDSLY